eukprot:g64634.t1
MKTVNKLDTNVWDEDHGLLSTPNSRKGTCGSMSWWQLALGAWVFLVGLVRVGCFCSLSLPFSPSPFLSSLSCTPVGLLVCLVCFFSL